MEHGKSPVLEVGLVLGTGFLAMGLMYTNWALVTLGVVVAAVGIASALREHRGSL
jgi:hypothetical protein